MPSSATQPSRSDLTDDGLPFTNPEAHYHMAESTRDWIEIASWVSDGGGDPALKGFRSRLVDHILARVLGDRDRQEYTDEERGTIRILNNRLYRHQALRINYTTYDIRREQDSINPRSHPDVMLLSPDDPADPSFHPYWYARVLMVFHVMVQHIGDASGFEEPRRLDVAWVRWMPLDSGEHGGWAARRLHLVGPMDLNSPDALGFVDPSDIVRAVHLMPAFDYGRSDKFATPSLARPLSDPDAVDDEWERYYVGMFVDRDMFMRYRGGGIGHLATRYCNKALRSEEHTLPLGEDFDTDDASERHEHDTQNNILDPEDDIQLPDATAEDDAGFSDDSDEPDGEAEERREWEGDADEWMATQGYELRLDPWGNEQWVDEWGNDVEDEWANDAGNEVDGNDAGFDDDGGFGAY